MERSGSIFEELVEQLDDSERRERHFQQDNVIAAHTAHVSMERVQPVFEDGNFQETLASKKIRLDASIIFLVG